MYNAWTARFLPLVATSPGAPQTAASPYFGGVGRRRLVIIATDSKRPSSIDRIDCGDAAAGVGGGRLLI